MDKITLPTLPREIIINHIIPHISDRRILNIVLRFFRLGTVGQDIIKLLKSRTPKLYRKRLYHKTPTDNIHSINMRKLDQSNTSYRHIYNVLPSGQLHGEYKIYSGTKLCTIANYQYGKKHGLYTIYDTNGDIKLTYDYKNDEIDGERREYYNGILIVVSSYKNSVKHGKHTEYYHDEAHSIYVECQYVDGKRHGYFFKYYTDHMIEEYLIYKNGIKQVTS